jgi:hypothetical protein
MKNVCFQPKRKVKTSCGNDYNNNIALLTHKEWNKYKVITASCKRKKHLSKNVTYKDMYNMKKYSCFLSCGWDTLSGYDTRFS